MFTWILALGGLSLALLLILTGRGGVALGALTLFGPLVYQRWQAARGRRSGGARPSEPNSTARSGPMSRQEALEVLGLHPGASATEIKDAPPFYYAEDYHQQYLDKNPDGYCGLAGTGVSCPVGVAVTAP